MAHYLRLELGTENIRGTVVDEGLDVVFSVTIEFDTELSEFQTRGGDCLQRWGMCTLRASKYMVLGKLKTGVDLAAKSHLSSLDPAKTLHAQLGTPSTLALVHTPIIQDTSTATQARAIETALGGTDALAQRLRTALLTTAAQAIKIREGNPDAWAHTSHVVLASAFLASLLIGD
ncbi:hypothetical protein CTheo_7505 [Ceratobasidium theobromae]|uniref:Uncharacterized protein n=1 Tax=Ceratobasidium theobromae TaxID=1582974 RepID=A0A5N5QC12_9AGAM|nr:hypothetical protein CTheo_7505 [Ceratobasidium theobromae]